MAVLAMRWGISASHAKAESSETPQLWFEAERGRVEVTWERGEDQVVRSAASIWGPHLLIVGGDTEDDKPGAAPPSGAGEVAREASPLPLDFDRLSIHDASLSFVSAKPPGRVLLRISKFESIVENFSTKRALSGGLPTLITGSGTIGRSGHIELFVTMNPWSKGLDFTGRAQVVGLELEEIAALVEEQADLRPTSGKMTVFMEFSVENGKLSGIVKPFLSGAEVAPADSGFFDQLKAWFATAAIEILSTEVRDRERVATEVPISGMINQPEPDLWSAIFGVIGNAFIEAIVVGYSQE